MIQLQNDIEDRLGELEDAKVSGEFELEDPKEDETDLDTGLKKLLVSITGVGKMSAEPGWKKLKGTRLLMIYVVTYRPGFVWNRFLCDVKGTL